MSGLSDGFLDLAAAQAGLRLVGRRMAMREGLNRCQSSLAALLHCLDQRADADCSQRTPLCECGIGLTGGDQQGTIHELAILGVEGREQAEQQLLQGVDLVLQFLDRLDAGMRHGLFSLRHGGEANPVPDAGHRLSEAAK